LGYQSIYGKTEKRAAMLPLRIRLSGREIKASHQNSGSKPFQLMRGREKNIIEVLFII
jgi:hypothetical protein